MAKAVFHGLFFVDPSVGVDGIIKIGVRDVNLSRIDANDWSLTVVSEEIDPIEITKGKRRTISLMPFLNHKSELPSSDNIVIKLTPTCDGCQPRPWNVCNGAQVLAIDDQA